MAKRVMKNLQESVEMVEIPLAMSAEEMADASRGFVQVSKLVDEHVDEKRQFLSGWREEHKAKKEEHDRLRSILAAGAAPKRLKAKVQLDFDEDEVRYLDPKSGATLHTRPMTADDRQLKVPGTGPAEDAPASDKPPAGEEGKPLRGKAKKPDLEKIAKDAGAEGVFKRPAGMF